MTNVRDFTMRICINHEREVYKLFSVGYHKDWWYFIWDLSSPQDSHFLVSKINVPGTVGTGESIEVPYDKSSSYTISVKNPKISHHIDGNSHISGVGIKSWYEQDWTAKGLSNKAGRLNERNDGWPIFTFSVWLWALNFFPKLPLKDDEKMEKIIKKRHAILAEAMVVDMRISPHQNYHYNIEAFIILKNDLPLGYRGEMLYKPHPLYGIIALIPLPSPAESPYIFAIWYIKDSGLFDSEYFSYVGAPWYPKLDGTWDMLIMSIRKNNPENEDSFQSLNYN